MKRFATALAILLLAASANSQSIGRNAHLQGMQQFCVLAVFQSNTLDGTSAIGSQLRDALLRFGRLYNIPVNDCLNQYPLLIAHIMQVGSAFYSTLNVLVEQPRDAAVWAFGNLTVSPGSTTESAITDVAERLLRDRFEQFVLAWRDANP